MKDLLLLLLTIIFVILSIFYIVSVCNYDIKELFIDNFSAIGNKCELDSVLEQGGNLKSDAKYTSEILRAGNVIQDYHTAYRCGSETYKSIYLREYIDVKNRDLLLAYSCIKIKPSTLITFETINSYKIMLTDTNVSYVEYSNIVELTNKIDSRIKTIISDVSLLNPNIRFLHFPIYVFISQAPYLKNSSENIKVTDSNRGADGTNYESCSTNYAFKNSEVCPDSFRMKAEVAIIFSGLTKEGRFITDINIVNNNINTLRAFLASDGIRSSSKQCFLNCGTKDSKYACGCLTMENSYTVNNKSYNSVCLTNNSDTSMTMVYFVNPYAISYSDSKYANKPPNLNEFRWYSLQT